MSSDNQKSSQVAYQPQPAYNDEISLIDIYLSIKRNSKLFFTVIVLSFIISLAITYFKYKSQPEPQTKALSSTSALISEYVLIIEVGRIFGDESYYIDPLNNILEKIKNIYIPKLNQSAITAEHIKNSDLIVITATEISDKVDYNKMLHTLANYILKDHNSGLNLNNKNNIKPTKIIQEPTKRMVKSNNKKTIKNKMLIPVLGLILGVFLGFVAVFIREFLKKVKEAEILQ